jgi:thioredoxin-like negative regulator of GroEL
MSEYLKYLPILLIVLLTLMQVAIRLSARRMRGRSIADLEGLLDASWLEKEKLVIYFSSAYCQPCKAMAPMIEKLSAESDNLVKLDAIEQGELASRLGARGAPAFVQLAKGTIVKVHLGSLTEPRLRQML